MHLHRIGTATLLLSGAMLWHAADAAAQTMGNEARCVHFATEKLGNDVRITSAAHVAATAPRNFVDPNGWGVSSGLPSYCKVEGVINERKGARGKDYGIRFAIALPDQWSGRFLLQGGGGLNGSVLPPLGPVASNDRPALARGFAVISHDSGHQGKVFDSSFMADQRAALDFAEASVRTVALLGKKITQDYYSHAIAHSYMTGCSTGGRESMLAFQRYPELFDGIVVGAPAMRTGDSNLAIEYSQALFNKAAPKGADGLPDVSRLFTPAVRKLLLNGMLDQCDSLDGLKDGMIENVAQCHFRPEKLMCRPGQNGATCLSPALVDALNKAFAGPRDKAGYAIYAPVPYDTGIVTLPMGYLPSGIDGPLGPASKATSIDLDARLHEVRNDASQRLTDTNYWTNLNTYLGRGGKILFFHGVSDFWFSPWATWDYYQRAAKVNGQAFTDASRFYMVPGMLHCQGGNSFDRFDLLGKIVDWVEKGQAPAAVTASRPAPAKESRPLCPFPGYARYTGGDTTKATSYACTSPTR